MEKKYVRLFGMDEIQLTACAVSRKLPTLSEPENYTTEPNQEWMKNPRAERAWVKIYHNAPLLSIIGPFRDLTIPMPFFGKDHNDCWGELQLRIKKSVERFGRTINLKPVKLGRNQSFDTRVNAWVKETKTIEPKRDLTSHSFIAFRLYHQNHLPPAQKDWHFEPVYAVVDRKDFYRIDARWEKEKITVTSARLNENLIEIPEFLNG